MATYHVTSPDGHVYEVTGPDGATQEEVLQQVMAQHQTVPADAPKASAPEPSLSHYAQVAGRSIAQGAAGVADMVQSGINQMPSNGLFSEAYKQLHLPPIRTVAKSYLTQQGVDSPNTPGQRVASDVGEALTAQALTMGAGAAGGGKNLLTANPLLQTLGSAGGATAGGVVRENGGSDGLQMMASLTGALSPAVIATLPQAILRVVVRGGEAGRQAMQAVMQDFKAAGATPSVGQATQRPLWRGVESFLAKLPGSSGVMERAAARQGNQIGTGVGMLADTLAPGADATSAGQAIRQGVIGDGKGAFQRSQADTSNRLYSKLDATIPANTRVPVPNTANVFSGLNQEIPGAPNLSPLFQNGRISGIASMFARDAAPAPGGLPGVDGPRLPYQAVQKLRTAVGKEVANSNFASDVPVGDWRAIYGGLTDDMKGAAQAQGPEAQQAFNRANSHYRAVSNRSEAIKHVVNQKVPEDVFSAAMRNTQDGATTLRKVMQSIPADAQKEVASAVLRRMGRAVNSRQDETGEAFSTQTFLTNWNKLGEPARKALFDRFGPEFRAQVDAITRVSNNLREGSKVFANPSGTATTAAHIGGYTALGSSGVGALLGHPLPFVATAGGMGGANLTARAMTSPKFVSYLAHQTPMPYGAASPLLRLLQQYSNGGH